MSLISRDWISFLVNRKTLRRSLSPAFIEVSISSSIFLIRDNQILSKIFRTHDIKLSDGIG